MKRCRENERKELHSQVIIKKLHIEYSNNKQSDFKTLFRCNQCAFIAGTPHNLTEHMKNKHINNSTA
jgi:hypothetical protein